MAAAHTAATGQRLGESSTPSATRIADILRSREPWPRAESISGPLDLAQRIVAQQKQIVDRGGYSTSKSPDPSNACLGLASGALDAKMFQLAERVAAMIAGVQRQSSDDRQDIERKFGSFSSRTESRLVSLEERVANFEEKRMTDVNYPEMDRMMREVRALVGGAVAEVQAQWRVQRTELMGNQQEHARMLEELSDHAKKGAARLQEVHTYVEGLQNGLDVQAENLKSTEKELRLLLAREDAPPWYGELEASVARLEHRMDEHRNNVEIQLGRFRVDAEGVRLRLEGMREDALCAVDRRIDQEVDRLQAQRVDTYSQHHSDKDSVRRLDDIEARLAAIRVRVDAHDGRFSALAERAEAACQQGVEGARQVACQQRDEILQEVDCQLSILRQRLEAVSEIYDELTVRQAAKGRWQVDNLKRPENDNW